MIKAIFAIVLMGLAGSVSAGPRWYSDGYLWNDNKPTIETTGPYSEEKPVQVAVCGRTSCWSRNYC